MSSSLQIAQHNTKTFSSSLLETGVQYRIIGSQGFTGEGVCHHLTTKNIVFTNTDFIKPGALLEIIIGSEPSQSEILEITAEVLDSQRVINDQYKVTADIKSLK